MRRRKKLMVKCFFYLVTSGISSSIKPGMRKSISGRYRVRIVFMPSAWTAIRMYLHTSALRRGNSKAGRGTYKRSLPFFNMRFPTYDDALGILLGTANMLDSLKAGKLILDGAPEFAGQIGNFMFAVADYAKG